MEEYERLRKNNISVDNIIKGLITNIRFSCIGNVSKVYGKGKRVDVTLPYMTVNNEPIVLKGAEVLRPGTHKVRVVYTPEIGDVAVVFAMQNYYSSGVFGSLPKPKDQCPFFDKYGNSTLKAILVQTNEDNEEAVQISIEEKVSIVCNKEINIDLKNSSSVNVNCPDADVKLKAKSVDINDGHLTVDVSE